MVLVFLLRRESQEIGKVRVFCGGKKKKKRKKETSARKMKLEASLYTQKGRDINENPKMPL